MHERPYQKLVVWREAHMLCVWIYGIAATFPTTEKYRLVDQLCRASASVPTNIAEGSTRNSPKERRRFYAIASASLEEVHYEILLSHELGYVGSDDFSTANDKIMRISYLLNRLMASL